MSTYYKPGFREILSEMRREVVDSKPFKFGHYFLIGCGSIITFPYVIPTYIRFTRETRTTPIYGSRMWGALGGVVTGAVLDLDILYNYVQDPRWFAVPIATNAVFALYEWGRHARGELINRQRESRRPRMA